jgi:hypothetical protein
MLQSFFDGDLPLAALMAFKPLSYVIRIATAAIAFNAAMDNEKVLGRVLGLVWLIVVGGLFLMTGLTKATHIDTLLGLLAVGAAGYSWHYTR